MLVCVFIIFQRIYRSMFSQEGYLTFTLPVSPSAVVSSKMISAVVWEIICGIVVALAVCIFAVIIVLGTDITFFEDIIRFIDRAMDFVTAEIVLIMFELLLCMLVGMVMTTLMIMTSLSVGAVIARKHKVLAAILVFFVIQVVINTVVSSLMMSVPAQLMAYDTTEQFYGILNRAFLQYAVIDLAVSAILFFAERFVISRKLNI